MTPTNGHSTQYSFLDRLALLLGPSIQERMEQRMTRLERVVAQGTNGGGKETVGVLPTAPAESQPSAPAESTRTDLGLNLDVAEVLSPSQCNVYLDCSAKWFFKYFRNLPDVTDAKRALGLAVHKALAQNFRQKMETKKDLGRVERSCSRLSP